MNETDIDKSIEDTAVSTKTAENRSTKKKTAPKIPTDETKTTEKKRKAPKVPNTEQESTDVTKNHNDDTQPASTPDQEVPVKTKKNRAPKIETNTEQPIKKKKSKAPKLPPTQIDDDFQVIETPTIEELEPYVERKTKGKKSKKTTPKISDSFEDLQVTNLDDAYALNSELNINPNGSIPNISLDTLPISENDTSEYERSIIDSYSNLASKVSFSQYVGNDQWCIIHLPKAARTEQKSRLRKMLPGGNKEEKPTNKPTVPKEGFLKRIRTGVNTLVRNENNLLFGERPNYDIAEYEDELDGVDTDDLHRYAQKLRELEDQDREVNPEFLVLHDGKTVYGVHESDVDGKVKLATRKPIYDRFADQTPDEQVEKRKLMARIKNQFIRNKDKDGKDSNSANTTPDPRANRKSTRKSYNEDLPTMTNDDPLMI